MPARTRSDLPETELRVIAESETDSTLAIDIPKTTIVRHRRFLEMLLEAVRGGDANG